jgi:hypothetical protein
MHVKTAITDLIKWFPANSDWFCRPGADARPTFNQTSCGVFRQVLSLGSHRC